MTDDEKRIVEWLRGISITGIPHCKWGRLCGARSMYYAKSHYITPLDSTQSAPILLELRWFTPAHQTAKNMFVGRKVGPMITGANAQPPPYAQRRRPMNSKELIAELLDKKWMANRAMHGLISRAAAHIAAQDARIEALEGALLHIVALCPASTGGMSGAALSGLLSIIDEQAKAALGGEQHGG